MSIDVLSDYKFKCETEGKEVSWEGLMVHIVNMTQGVKARSEILLERIRKVENYMFCEECSQALKDIYASHLKYLREELKKCEGQ